MTPGQFGEVDLDLLADYVGGVLDGTPDKAMVEGLIHTSPQWREAHQALAGAVEPVSEALTRWSADTSPMPADVTDRLLAAIRGADSLTAGPEPDGAAVPATPAAAGVPAARVPIDGPRPDLVASRPDPAGGPEPAGPDPTGLDPAGLEPASPDLAGLDLAGPDSASPPMGDPGVDGGRGLEVRSRRGAGNRSGTNARPGTSPRPGTNARPGTSPRPGAGDRPDRDRRPGRSRRWQNFAAPVAVAAAVVAFGGFGIALLGSAGDSQDAGSTVAGQEGAAPATLPDQSAADDTAPRVFAETAPQQLLATGTDYTPATLPGAIAGLAQRAGTKDTEQSSPPQAQVENHSSAAPTASAARTTVPSEQSAPTAPTGLARLAQRTILSTCLAAVTAEHAQGNLAVQIVDYASFEGDPALVVFFTDSTDARWAWVAGPECGQPGSGADTRHRARVG